MDWDQLPKKKNVVLMAPRNNSGSILLKDQRRICISASASVQLETLLEIGLETFLV